MFVINEDKTMYLTRGDVAVFTVGANVGETAYTFRVGDVVRFKVFEKKGLHRGCIAERYNCRRRNKCSRNCT